MQAVEIFRGVFWDDKLAVVARRAQAFTKASGIAIALREQHAGEIICRARAGSSAPEVGTALRGAGTLTGLCIQSGKELCCYDAETDTRVDKAAVRALGIRSMVVIPIKDEGRVVGVLAAFAPTAYAFTITHMAVLKAVANQIAAYLKLTQRDEAYSPELLPAPPMKALVAWLPRPPAVLIESAAPALTPWGPSVVPKVEPLRASTSAEEIDPAPFSQRKTTNSHDEQTEYKTYFPSVFGTMDAVAAPENRSGAKVFMIGAAVVAVLALAVGLSFKSLKPAAAPQAALETPSSPATRAAPAPASDATPVPASDNVEPPAKNTALAPAANHEETQPRSEEAQPKREHTQPKREQAQPKREEIVVLSAGPAKIARPQPAKSARAGDPALPQPANSARLGDSAKATDNSVPASDAPAISRGSGPASGPVPNFASPVLQPPDPRLLKPSNFEPAMVIKEVPPTYPVAAKQQRLSGRVVVQGTINKNGRITDLQLISGPPVFRDAAFEAVRQWIFQPARVNGQEIELSVKIHLDFGLE